MPAYDSFILVALLAFVAPGRLNPAAGP